MQYEQLFYTIVVFIYGLLIGSFLNVCIYRIPRGESIVTGRSHCTNCNKLIQWYDLVPLVSYILLRGKCRNCKTKISIQYPLIELLNGLLYVFIIETNGFHLTSILYCLCVSALIALSIIDFKTFEIPVQFNYFIGFLGVIRLIYDYRNWTLYLTGFVSVSGFLLILYFITRGRGIGGGDIKLMAAAGLLLGWKLILLSLVLGCIYGSVLHIAMMMTMKKERVLAFGPYLSMGIYTAMLFGNSLIKWYINYL